MVCVCDLGTCPWAVCFTWGDTSGEEDCDLVSLHTLLPGRVRAREDKENTTEHPGRSTREQNEYISGETQTARQSQLSSNRQRSLRHVCRFYPGGVTDRGFEDWYEGWRHHTLRSLDPSLWICKEGGTTEYMRRHQSMKLLTEMNFEGWFIKTKHS